jgi:YesN/AraC family two-component response regulator
VAYVQAQANPRRAPSACRPLGRAVRSLGKGPPRSGNDGDCEAPKVMSRSEFDRAAKLLQLIVEHAQTADLADLEAAELTKANRTILGLEQEQKRLREKLNLLLPVGNDTACVPQQRTHTEQIVSCLVASIHQNYSQPITLRQCARELGMNAAYLSELFAHATGMHFKSYLTEFRIERAKDLLGKPDMNISDAGYAVGYASENRFRLAFKAATGLPPKIWRETLRTATPALLVWLLGEMEFVESLEALFGV